MGWTGLICILLRSGQAHSLPAYIFEWRLCHARPLPKRKQPNLCLSNLSHMELFISCLNYQFFLGISEKTMIASHCGKYANEQTRAEVDNSRFSWFHHLFRLILYGLQLSEFNKSVDMLTQAVYQAACLLVIAPTWSDLLIPVSPVFSKPLQRLIYSNARFPHMFSIWL